MRFRDLAFMAALLLPSVADADPLALMAGRWTGTGWARETVKGPQETLRCKLTNTYEAATLTLTLKGQCVVPGRKISLAGKLTGAAQSDRITGRWFNPDGLGSTPVLGVQRGDMLTFKFSATDPNTGQKHAQNVAWQVEGTTLRLRATDRARPDIMMSDITFTN